MLEEKHTYYVGDLPCKGLLVYDNTIEEQRPAILIVHTWKGQDEFIWARAREIARLGYIAFAVDMFGNGKRARSDEEAAELITPLFLDRQLVRDRIQGAYQHLIECHACDPQNIGAIGFCFGGLVVIELLRSGCPISGVVSFHGVLGHSLADKKAKIIPNAPKIHGSLLVLHGYNDPLVSQEDIEYLEKEMTAANVDWQIHVYGNTSHAFTNPQINDPVHGLVYNQKSAMRAWRSMQNFFKEIFNS